MDDVVVANHNVRILGRRGVMEVALAADRTQMQAVLPLFRKVLAGFEFNPGERYSDYRPGDTIAPVGLGALITGEVAPEN